MSKSQKRMNGDEPSYPIYLWNGILEAKHVEAIGPAIWLFIWCIDRTTDEKERKGVWEGRIYGGMPLPLDEIAADLKTSGRTISRHLERLMAGGYIRLILTPRGYSIRVVNSCKWPKKQTGQTGLSDHSSNQPTPAKVSDQGRQKCADGRTELSGGATLLSDPIRQSSSYGLSSDEAGDETTPRCGGSSPLPVEEKREIQPQRKNQEKPVPVEEDQPQDPETIRIFKQRMARDGGVPRVARHPYTQAELDEQLRIVREKYPEQFAKADGVAIESLQSQLVSVQP